MLLLIPLLPFIGFVINALLGRRLSKAVSGGIACAAVVGAFALATAAVVRLVALPPASRAIAWHVFEWVHAGTLSIAFTLRLDPLAAVMILVITGIGSLIHVYSTSYMHGESDSEFARFFSYLGLFVAFMLVLVLGASFPVMFVGWEGVGLCSYLLIGFWYEKKSASDAGKKAFIVNRIGDFGFVLGMLLLVQRFGTLDFQEIARAASSTPVEAGFGVLTLATLLLFVGATGKSAQIPLYVWLPDAMEGPTPVSALIHAATMVTAGVYMIGRNAVLFSHAPQTLGIIAVVGGITALMAGTIGLVQTDIKRVLAYSTVSQLGYMFLAMGVGAYTAGIFHLYTHAFFKALLFLGSGAVIHALDGEQDLRRMGGLARELPITYWTFLVGSLAIAGVPGLAGFFSKDEILFRTFSAGHTALWVIGVLTSLMTATYMFRLVFLVFHGVRRTQESSGPGHVGAHGHGGGHGGGSHLHDAPAPMALALVVLAIGSVLAGYVGVPHALGGRNALESFLAPSFAAAGASGQVGHTAAEPAGRVAQADAQAEAPQAAGESEVHESDETGTELALMGVSTVMAFSGIGLAVFFFLKNPSASDAIANNFAGLRTVLLNKYYVDEVYDAAIVQPLLLGSEQALWKTIDARVIDGSVNGAADSIGLLAHLLRTLQSGSVRVYAAWLFVGVTVLLGCFLW